MRKSMTKNTPLAKLYKILGREQRGTTKTDRKFKGTDNFKMNG